MSVAQFADVEFGEAELGESILGTLSTPTFVFSTSASVGRITLAVTNSGTAPDYNEVWRYESGQDAKRLTASLPANGTFDDYNVASGVTYFYYVRAVQSGGGTADSPTDNTSVTLSVNLLHIVAKNASNNYDSTYGVLTLPLMAPISRPSVRDDRILIEPGRTKPVIATSDTVDRSYQGILMFTGYPNSDQTTLQNMYDQKAVYCVRDVEKHLLFGTMAQLRFAYQHTYSQAELSVLETDYEENVA
jgi:hypothetical protein